MATGPAPKPVDDWQIVAAPEPNDWQPIAAVSAAAPAPKSLRDRLTEIQKPDPTKPWAASEAAKAIGNVGAGFMTPILHPVDTLAAVGGLITAPFEKLAGSKKPTVYEDMYHAVKENPYGFIESGIGQAAAAEGAGELAPRVPETSVAGRAKALTRAAGAESAPVNIVDAFKTALPDLLETQGISGELAKNPVQLSKIVGDSLSRTETEFNLKMQPIAGQEFMPSGIADEIEAKAREFPSKTAESRAIRTSLMKRAAEFRQPWNLQELNQERMASNGRLYGFAGKKGSAQAAVTHTNADIIADQIIARASRDVIYDRMEAHYGTPDYFRALKKRQSAMIAISDQMAKQLVKLGNLEAYDNLLGRLRGHSYMSSGGHVGFSLGNLLGAPFSEAFKAGRGVKKGLAPPREAGSAAPQAILTGATALAPRATPPAPRRNPSDEWADPAQLQR